MLYEHYLHNNLPVLVTTNVKDKKPLFLNEAFAREACEAIYRVQELHPFLLHAFVVMPNHCHLFVTVPANIGISKIMRVYKASVAHSIGLGPIWQSRFDSKYITKFWNAKRYIDLNPVRAGLVNNPENYPWSSASGKWEVTELFT